MPISHHPFLVFPNGNSVPALPILISNPLSAKTPVRTFGIIDTGASSCAYPGFVAEQVGHRINAVTPGSSNTGNGIAESFPHTTTIKILSHVSQSIVYVIDNKSIDVMPNLHVVLLGVKNFLEHFVLEIDYLKKTFSIRRP